MLYDREKIVALRGRLGVSRNELARRAGISGPSMLAIERGDTKNIRASTLFGLANALGVRVQDIMKAGQKRGETDQAVEALTLFNTLELKDKQAILAAMRVMGGNGKKKI